jgi:hypothetical protein
LFEERLQIALALLEQCERLYIGSNERHRRDYNQTFFAAVHIDQDGVNEPCSTRRSPSCATAALA